MSTKVVEDAKEIVSEVEQAVKEVELTGDQALNILMQAVRLAQKRGAFELEEVEQVLKAIKVFILKK